MRISIIGTGYVGLVNGVCMAYKGANVTCIDINKEKINGLNNGILPIYEEGLKDIMDICLENGKLKFSTDYSSIPQSDATFICVGTPEGKNGEANLDYVFGAARSFSEAVDRETILVVKSTCPVGTTYKVKELVCNDLVHCVFNPEFLKEGKAIHDCLNPERVVIGIESGDNFSKEKMQTLYNEIMGFGNVVFTDILSAEMVKYASNAMLATRISFINEIANLCEKVGADVDAVSKCVGMDTRIGPKFLNAGCGYGGSCFPKDVKALINTAKNNDCSMFVLNAVDKANDNQKHVLFNKFKKYQTNKKMDIAVLGLSFKPNTDDIREAPAITLINDIQGFVNKIVVCDPIAMDNTKKMLGDSVVYESDPYAAVSNADIVFIVTEWDEFKKMDPAKIKDSMRGNIIIDGRNIFDRNQMKNLGFIYDRIG